MLFRKKDKPKEPQKEDFETAPAPVEEKGPQISLLPIIIWLCLFMSWFGMVWMAKLPMNAFTTIGYAFLVFACVMAGIVALLYIKTPAFTFLKAFLYGMNIMEVRRKDGQIDFTLGKYGQGRIHSKRYGIFFVNPDAVKHEGKTGRGIIHVIDSIGTALTEKFVLFINTMRDKFGFNNIDEIEDGLRRWSKCECGWIGVPPLKPEKKQMTDKKTGEETNITEWHETCGKCGKEDKLVKHSLPPNFYNTLLALDYGIGDQFLRYNINPDRQEVIIEQEVKNRMAKEKASMVKWVAIIFAMGMAGFLVLLGASIFVPQIINAMASAPAVAPPPMVG